MGVVCRARDPRIGRLVAVKLLRVGDDAMRQRFLQEAQSAGSLQHRNIVTIYVYGEQDGESYIVMELVEGFTLAEQIGTGRALPIARKLELIEELARGLEYAHNRGIVHRDVKPGNVMISTDGVLKILDFGIARVGGSSLTRAGTMIGTPNYMSPEQVEGRVVDRRSDVFAVGLVFYELLTGRQAFSGATVREVVDAVVKREPMPLAEACPGLDPAFDAIVRRAIHKDPARRYRTLSILAADVARLRARVAKPSASADPPTVAIMSGESETVVQPRAPRLAAQSELVAKRRARIDEYLRGGQMAFEAGNFAAAIDACDQAGLLDPDEPRVRDLLERACNAIDKQQIAAWLAEARSCVERDALDEASALLVRVAELAPDSSDAREVANAIDERRQWRQEEDARREAVVDALTRARASLTSGQFDVAIRAASEVLLHDPLHEEAHQLSQRAVADLQERRHQQRLAQAAQAIIDTQKREFAAGRHRAAIEALERATPAHALIDGALTELRAELEAIEQRAREAADRRRQEEEERRRREEEVRRQREEQQRRVMEQMAGARRLIAAGQFVEALRALADVERVPPHKDGIAALIAEARAGQAAVEAAARRERQIADALARTSSEIDRGNLSQASAIVDDILKLAPDHPQALAKRADIAAAIERIERQQAQDREAERIARTARDRFKAGDHAGAMALLESSTPPHPTTAAALVELKSMLAEIERRRREEEERRQALVRDAIARARAAADRTAFAEATALLEPFASSDPIAAETLAGILRDAAAHEARLRLEREAAERRLREEREAAQRRAEQERVARQQRIEEQFRVAAAEIAAGNLQTALDRFERLGRAEGDVPGLETAIADLRADLAAAERERLRKEAEAAHLELQRWTRAQIADARERLQHDDPQSAVQLLDRARSRLADAPESAELEGEVAAILTAARKRVRVQTLLAEARERVDHNAHTEALAKVDAVLALDPRSATALALKAAIREAIEAQARRDLEEFRRDRKAAEERYARERSEKVAQALERAGTTQSPRDAMLILAEALRLDPRNRDCVDLAAARQAELMVLVAALIDENRFADALQALEGLDEVVTTKDRLNALRDRAIIGRAVEERAERSKRHE